MVVGYRSTGISRAFQQRMREAQAVYASDGAFVVVVDRSGGRGNRRRVAFRYAQRAMFAPRFERRSRRLVPRACAAAGSERASSAKRQHAGARPRSHGRWMVCVPDVCEGRW